MKIKVLVIYKVIFINSSKRFNHFNNKIISCKMLPKEELKSFKLKIFMFQKGLIQVAS